MDAELANQSSKKQETFLTLNTRRKFLSDCTLSLAALALVPVSSATAALAQQSPAVALTYAALSAQVDSVFKIRLNNGQIVNLTLCKARLAPPARIIAGSKPPVDLHHEKFSLVFNGPQDAVLGSAIHSVEHAALGKFELHLGPIGTPGTDGVRYEAVFNRPATPPHFLT